jgi:hypothetical protein
MLRFILNLFSGPPRAGMINHRRLVQTRNLVRRFARGNTRLQEGRYLTEEDTKNLKDKALHCHF